MPNNKLCYKCCKGISTKIERISGEHYIKNYNVSGQVNL